MKYKIDTIPNVLGKVNKRIFPLPFMCLIVGTSGCGKTTLLYNLITEEWGIYFHSVYIFSKLIEQDAYKELKRHMKNYRIKKTRKWPIFITTANT
jgi:ABC-type lipoprotein export system ATPase subunit